MRRSLLLLTILGAACGSDTVMVDGTLDAESGVRRVWAVGATAPIEPVDGVFTLEALPAGPLDLRFDDGTREIGRMVVGELPAGARLTLNGVWIDERAGTAFPTSVELGGAPVATINHLRFAGEGRVPRRFDGAVAVLAADGGGDAMLVRAADASLPDLRVVLTPGTLVRGEDGEPAEARRIRSGDTIQLRAQREARYLLAQEIVVSRDAARRQR